ncbi:MAG: cupredoxin domain-containing protein [Trueperaceae bacterium]|nr:MAG: cupredoxin domain-containing protein [Trueperaceae bacterium]
MRLTILGLFLLGFWVLSGLQPPTRAQAGGDTPQERIAAGRLLFEQTAGGMGCAVCHGNFGMGDLGMGSYIRGIGEQQVRDSLESVEAMASLSLSEEEIRAVTTYLQWLGTLVPAEVFFKRGTFTPSELRVTAGKTVQLIITNSDRTEHRFTNLPLGIENFTVPSRSALDVIFTVPTTEGSFSLSCLECGPDSIPLAVIVRPAE